MSRPHPLSWRPALPAWALGATLAVAFVALPTDQIAAGTTPMCFGKPATIVRTNRDDVIRGTRGRDVIVARGGADRINGRGGNDLICAGGGDDIVRGGGGADRISGGGGADRVLGNAANDRLKGGAGDDVIGGGDGDDAVNGGSGTDECQQDAGTGVIRNCETSDPETDPGTDSDPEPAPANADLSVRVKASRASRSGMATFTVTVSNNGPDAAPYTLTLTTQGRRVACRETDWAGATAAAKLTSGASRTTRHVVVCRKTGGGASVRLVARVTTTGIDPVTDNDTASAKARVR